jgi:hypothetical protein
LLKIFTGVHPKSPAVAELLASLLHLGAGFVGNHQSINHEGLPKNHLKPKTMEKREYRVHTREFYCHCNCGFF